MYRKDSEGWLKHFDFLVLDLLCLQVAFVLAYGISGYGFYPYNLLIYRNMAIFIEFADIVVLFACGTLKNVLKKRTLQRVSGSVPEYNYVRCSSDIVSIFIATRTEVFTTCTDS